MAENENSLDAFLTTKSDREQTSDPELSSLRATDVLNLEDKFTKLLDDFISQNKNSEPAKNPAKNTTETPTPSEGLDSFVTSPAQTVPNQTSTTSSTGLDSFVSPAKQAVPQGLDSFVTQADNPQNTGGLDSFIGGQKETAAPEKSNGLKDEERELARAVANFQDGVYALADKKNFKMPETEYTEEALKPNYKPSVGKKIAQYMLACWDIINKYDPENMKRLSKDATDEEYLSFAETLNDTAMQLAIISYVEILINLEICENSYEQRKEEIRKNRIKRELYEEYMELQERKAMFIRKLKEKNFPIDVDRLINNYFRVAQKDPDGSFEALTKNPAMFSPIEFDKIRPKFFGLIKVTPEDGIKANQKIGSFIKKLKV